MDWKNALGIFRQQPGGHSISLGLVWLSSNLWSKSLARRTKARGCSYCTSHDQFLNGKMDEIPELGIKLFQPKEYTNRVGLEKLQGIKKTWRHQSNATSLYMTQLLSEEVYKAREYLLLLFKTNQNGIKSHLTDEQLKDGERTNKISCSWTQKYELDREHHRTSFRWGTKQFMLATQISQHLRREV